MLGGEYSSCVCSLIIFFFVVSTKTTRINIIVNKKRKHHLSTFEVAQIRSLATWKLFKSIATSKEEYDVHVNGKNVKNYLKEENHAYYQIRLAYMPL